MITLVFPSLTLLWKFLKTIDRYTYPANLDRFELTGSFTPAEINLAVQNMNVTIKPADDYSPDNLPLNKTA